MRKWIITVGNRGFTDHLLLPGIILSALSIFDLILIITI